MITPTAGFIVYGVHKDGLQDPMGTPFIDDALVARSKQALRAARHPTWSSTISSSRPRRRRGPRSSA